MRNFYHLLGIATSATTAEILHAIDKCTDASLCKDAKEALLDPNRKNTYDRLNNLLIDIGRLRANLGIRYAENWNNETALQYISFEDILPPQYNLFLEKIRKRGNYTNGSWTNSIYNKIKTAFQFFGVSLFILLMVCVIFASFYGENEEEKDKKDIHVSFPPQIANSVPAVPAFNEPPLALPQSGTVRSYTAAKLVAPLEIQTSRGVNYLVKLEDNSTRMNIMDIFVRGGDTIEVSVPLVNFTLKYACGKTWYGYEHLFGPATSYSKADSAFAFYEDAYQISGYTVTLYQVADGNLSTSQIGPAQF